ncbi:hypothetical protein VXN63_02320 [Marinilactibacillus sp. XAAS-LB27]|uniref:hypothetical protein n=1 Tax=Marinilactibacillus sp. XAAS-LB27 TaxID=3114538 RepID=UPI002E17E6E6|nr:hypothetical protein [Marinilactibacillus sp. XAAS-LB27]
MVASISLTQFLTFTTKVSTSAKINEVKRIKNSPDYSPGIDYWKQLRDEIKRIHENDLPISELLKLSSNVSEPKQRNYAKAIKNYVSFINNNEVEYFKPDKSYYNFSEDLSVRTSPELGLIVNGKRLYVKNWYKVSSTDTKINKRSIKSTLTMMRLSTKNFEVTDDENFAVLNLQNGKLTEATPVLEEDLLELEVDAGTFLSIWKQI